VAPDIVINCIGILNRDAEENPDKAILLNSYFPHFLARTGKKLGFKLIHISTDCVFNGKTGGYTEESLKDGIGFYAQSKAMGEVSYGNNLTLRTSIIGPELKSTGIGLFNWFMQQKGTIKGYGQAYWSGVTTLQLAKTLVEIIRDNKLMGLVHLTNNQKINKYDLLNAFKGTFNRNLDVELFSDYKVDKSLINTRDDVRLEIPSYEHMFSEMRNWIESHPSLYLQYGQIR
jgi:dTDP-4-dehydrorhamnose reductase